MLMTSIFHTLTPLIPLRYSVPGLDHHDNVEAILLIPDMLRFSVPNYRTLYSQKPYRVLPRRIISPQPQTLFHPYYLKHLQVPFSHFYLMRPLFFTSI